MKSEKGKVIVFFVVLDLKVVVESIQLYVDGYKLKWWEWDTAQIVCSQIELCSMMIAVGEFVLVWRYVVCSTALNVPASSMTTAFVRINACSDVQQRTFVGYSGRCTNVSNS